MPAIVNTVNIYAGDTAIWPIYVIKDANNQARDLESEGWTNWKAQWRSEDQPAVTFPLDVDTTKLNQGIIIITASSTITRQMKNMGVWDIQSSDPNNVVKTWLRGKTLWFNDVAQ